MSRQPIDSKLALEVAFREYGPPDGARARLFAAVVAGGATAAGAGGAAATLGSGTGAAAKGTIMGWTLKILAPVTILGAVGGGTLTYQLATSAPEPATPASQTTRATSGQAAAKTSQSKQVKPAISSSVERNSPKPEAEEMPDPEATQDAQAPIGRAPARARDSRGATREELELIASASAALRQQQPQRAMSVLRQHQKQFPAGALSLERRGLRVLALCALGDHEAARRERSAFLKHAGNTPLAVHVRRTCAR